MSNKITIGWTGPVSPKKYGGTVYGDQTKEALSENIDLEVLGVEGKHFKNRYFKTLESLYYLTKLEGKKDLWIRDFFSTVTMPLDKTQGKNLTIIHHVGFFTFPLIAKIPYFILERIFFRNLRKVDAILTISEYWKNYFLERGYPNVYKVYCGFDLSNFNISEQEVADFKKRYNLEEKPIVYLGNCQKAKGVVDSYNALKGLDVHLITSGAQQVRIPAKNFHLGYREYLTLLKASSVALIMFKVREGWSITAHESMLLRTPVIGTDLGALKELLGEGKQIICKDFKNLRENVEYLLNHPEARKKMGEDGYNFAKDFTLERFKKEWINVVSEVLLKN